MGIQGVRLYDENGDPYNLNNPLPIEASITSNLNISTQTSAPVEISATKATNTAANPLYVSVVGASGATGTTITTYNISATAATIPAVAGLLTRTLQNADTVTTIFIGNTTTVSPTTIAANIELKPQASIEDEDWGGALYAIVPTGSSAYLKVYEVIA